MNYVPFYFPVGNYIPISQVRDDVAAAFVKEVEWEVTAKLRPYKKMCDLRKVKYLLILRRLSLLFTYVLISLFMNTGPSGDCTDRV